MSKYLRRRARFAQLDELLLNRKYRHRQINRNRLIAVAKFAFMQAQPIKPARHRIAKRAIGFRQTRGALKTCRAYAHRFTSVTVRMHLTPAFVIAVLKPRRINYKLALKSECRKPVQLGTERSAAFGTAKLRRLGLRTFRTANHRS